tara:strand:- start:398 stop:694 length:297 start_codon:yes stop_codon:yes gene_type:complete
MIKVNKENINFSTKGKEQLTAYVEHAPEYDRKEVCSRIFWNEEEEGEKDKREFIASMINLIVDTRDNIIITQCPVTGETADRDKEVTIYSWIGEGVKK